MTIKILSDSGCDLPNEIIKKYNIEILPIVLIKDDKEYFDKIDIQSQDVYDDMRNGQIYKTAQIPPNIYNDKFNEYGKNKDSVIYIAFSSGLSGTYESSLLVRELVLEKYPDLDLDIVDSKAACSGFGTMVIEAAKMAEKGKAKQEILNMLEFYRNHMEHIFTVDDVEYLFKGGRITRTQAFVGGVLNIKPIINMEDGRLVLLEKARGKNKVIKTMLNIMEEKSIHADIKNQIIGISHGDDIKSALKLKEMIEEKYGVEKFVISTIGGTIGAHSGPGTLGITFLNKKYC